MFPFPARLGKQLFFRREAASRNEWKHIQNSGPAYNAGHRSRSFRMIEFDSKKKSAAIDNPNIGCRCDSLDPRVFGSRI